MFLNISNVHNIADILNERLKFPYVYIQVSTLGGIERPSIIVTISKTPKAQWTNGILQNSKYAQIHIDTYGIVEHFSGSRLKMRKFRAEDVDHIVEKINNIKER